MTALPAGRKVQGSPGQSLRLLLVHLAVLAARDRFGALSDVLNLAVLAARDRIEALDDVLGWGRHGEGGRVLELGQGGRRGMAAEGGTGSVHSRSGQSAQA